MADVNFETKAPTITKRTVSDNDFRIMIDYQGRKLTISMPLKTHYSDGTVEVHRKELFLRDDDFIVAIEHLFPAKAWDKPAANFAASVVEIMKIYKERLN